MQQDARHAVRLAAGVLVAVVAIMAAKAVLFWLTRSSAVLADVLESFVNLFTATMVLFSTWYASRPPDREHPYGHGRVEFLATGIEGVLIILAGGAIAVEAIVRLMHGSQVVQPGWGAAGMVVMSIVLYALGRAVERRGQAVSSQSLQADGRHLMVDGVSSLAVAAALALVAWTDWRWLDPAAAGVICGIVWITGFKLIARAWSGLLDRIDVDDLKDIEQILGDEVKLGRIKSFEKVRLRHDGADHWVDMHLRFDADQTVEQAHDIASAIEYRIEQHLGRACATAHIEPASPSD